VSAHSAELLIQALEYAYGGEIEAEDVLQGNLNSFYFEEVNYARLVDDVREILCEHGFSWDWSWCPGGGYGAGMELHNALSGETAEFATIDCEIVLTLDQIRDANVLAKAEKWGRFTLPPLQVLDNHHEVLAAVAKGTLTEAQAALWAARNQTDKAA